MSSTTDDEDPVRVDKETVRVNTRPLWCTSMQLRAKAFTLCSSNNADRAEQDKGNLCRLVQQSAAAALHGITGITLLLVHLSPLWPLLWSQLPPTREPTHSLSQMFYRCLCLCIKSLHKDEPSLEMPASTLERWLRTTCVNVCWY